MLYEGGVATVEQAPAPHRSLLVPPFLYSNPNRHNLKDKLFMFMARSILSGCTGLRVPMLWPLLASEQLHETSLGGIGANGAESLLSLHASKN